MDMSIIIERVDQTEVFLNEGGGVTIKQECWPDDSVSIALPIASIPAIIAALLDVEKEAGE